MGNGTRGCQEQPLVYADRAVRLPKHNTETVSMEGLGKEQIELPIELAVMISNADGEAQKALRFFPVYGYGQEGEMCSFKHESKFEAWEDSFRSLDECCRVVFGYDYETCIGTGSLELGHNAI